MTVKATITIDDDKAATRPYGVIFSDRECNEKYGKTGLGKRDECYQIIESARRAGYDINANIDERFY